MEHINEIEVLRQELRLISNLPIEGVHSLVAEKNSISMAYLYQIRSGRNLTLDTKENRELIQALVTTYRQEYRKKLNAFQNILNQNLVD